MQGDLVVYGADDRQGQALLVISALHHCGKWLAEKSIRVRFIAVTHVPVRLAIEVLKAETGLDAVIDSRLPREAADELFEGVALYVAVAFSRPGPLALAEARKRGVVCLAALQFPTDAVLTAEFFANLRCAMDPRELARRLRQEIQAIERSEGVSRE